MKKLAVILMVSAVILSLSFASGASETNSKINVISREEGSGRCHLPGRSKRCVHFDAEMFPVRYVE